MAKYDPVTLVGFTTSLLAIISCILTLVTLSREWRRRTDFARDVVDVHRREIDVLGHILDECRHTIMAMTTDAVPESVLEALRMCEQRQADLQRVMAVPALQAKTSWLALNLRLPLLEKELKRKYEMFKEDVVLLRALCSELRSQRQLVEVTAGIARLITGFVIDIDPDDSKTLAAASLP